jgi:Zn-dependent protease
MKNTLKLGKVLGTKLEIHWTFLLLLAYVGWTAYSAGGSANDILLQIGFIVAVFICVVLHELGHVKAAAYYKIPTDKITLLPIGGVAAIKRMPEKPFEELVVAIAGPLVNVIIALALFLVFPVTEIFESIANANPEEVAGISSLSQLPFYLFSANIILFAFNLIPAFPMDGGRILRALLSMKMSRLRATKIAASTGQFLAVGFFIIGLMYNPILALVGVFIFFGARSENFAVKSQQLLKGYEVQDAMSTDYIAVRPDENIKDAIKKMVQGPDIDLLVIDNEENVLGIATRDKLIDISKNDNNSKSTIKEIMTKKYKSVSEEIPLSDIYMMLQRKRNKLFPVISGNQLRGVINFEKIQQFIMMRAKGFQY